jgi:hypothetical protein
MWQERVDGDRMQRPSTKTQRLGMEKQAQLVDSWG